MSLHRYALLLVLLLFTVGSANAITWFPKDFNCPIDGEKNTFLVVGSYGSYIYSYPSKYQWLFFPVTDSPTFYLCKKCHLSTYMWDFDKLPKEKLDTLKKALADVSVSKPFEKYTEIPVVERLAIMELVYSHLDKDQEWWEQFYRIQGYHYGEAGAAIKAAKVRRKSLDILNEWIEDEDNPTSKKLLLYMSGAMHHFLDEDDEAIKKMEAGLTTKYFEKDATSEELKNGEENLNSRLRDYIDVIKSTDKKPRILEKNGRGHSH